MRCAMELQMTAMAKAEQKAREEAARKAKEAAIIEAATFKKCEELGATLEALAEAGQNPVVNFRMRWGRVLGTTNQEYVDHRLSYFPTRTEISLDVMRAWFAQWCFKVEVRETYGWIYGAGEVSMDIVTIRPDAECLK